MDWEFVGMLSITSIAFAHHLCLIFFLYWTAQGHKLIWDFSLIGLALY